MIRQPTPREALYRWHARAVAGLRPPTHEGDPQCGWFRTRLVGGGPFVPAAIWCEQDMDPDTGDLCAPERLMAAVGIDRPIPAARVWMRLASKPISEDAYREMMHRLTHGARHERATHAPVDLLDQFRSHP